MEVRSSILLAFDDSIFSPIEQIDLILATIDRVTSDGKRDYAILQLAAASGLRAGDIASLALDDIDWRSDEIHIIQGSVSFALQRAQCGKAALRVLWGTCLVRGMSTRPELIEVYHLVDFKSRL